MQTIHNIKHNLELSSRRFSRSFDDIPLHWCGGDAVVTHMLNTYTVLVPGNEGYFIRTLQRALPAVADDKQMQTTIRDFCTQEGQHGIGHRRCWDMLTSQGYTFKPFERAVAAFAYRFMERITPQKLRLSMVACIEHINAFIAHEFLSQQLLANSHRIPKALFEWHFAEEIEHKHVAFDVLQKVAPSYSLRCLGALVVAPLFYLLMFAGTLNFLHQDRLLFRRSTWRAMRLHFWGRDHMVRRTFGHIVDYLRPGFHPNQLDNRALADQAIARSIWALSVTSPHAAEPRKVVQLKVA